ncbi:MAG: hypothetical protein ABSB75_06455 [Candidatus Limnocylindrales bacterium]
MASKVAAYGTGYTYTHSFGVSGQYYVPTGPLGYNLHGTMTATYSITQYGYYGTNTSTSGWLYVGGDGYATRNWDKTVWNSAANATDFETDWTVSLSCYPRGSTRIHNYPFLRLSVTGTWSYNRYAYIYAPNTCSASLTVN